MLYITCPNNCKSTFHDKLLGIGIRGFNTTRQGYRCQNCKHEYEDPGHSILRSKQPHRIRSIPTTQQEQRHRTS